MSAELLHIDVGAYALGLLEERDRRAFEAHLPACASCQEELGALRGIAATLDGIAPIADPSVPPPAPPAPAVVSDLLRHRARRERKRRTGRALAGLAAGIVLLGGALGTGFTLGADRGGGTTAAPPPDGMEALFQNGQRLTAGNAGTGVSGTVAMEPRMWGSRVGLLLTRVKGPLECQLVAVDGAGRPHTVAGWSVPAKGYGLPGSPMRQLMLQGGTALKPGDISRFEVRTMGDGRAILTVPA
ncbi:zf-HC2 domain-containing protein [Actinomadura graeca]|uniref:Zf-HC2 domain-containing protein n=1 Tax=Actinomadura graeca TaxID=2750812 RepID=A0ABX8QPP1_9ACTN|nr:zf-HC2 domain-containing protein [Actinomadura graeca]QXJ20381.1 zf-HC2 domain-containing protein [Actinomadura graeca]